MALISIGGESFTALLFASLVGAYKLSDARESLSKLRDLVAEIDQQVAGFNGSCATGNSYG
jgi:hypothetical protein